ncbi:FGGY family carbohydrate kinase, partial [Tessaracoccus sp.]
MSTTMAAVDLGASSGRVMVGTLFDGRITLAEAGRFPNGPIQVPTDLGPRMYWDVLRLWDDVTRGLRVAAHDFGPMESVAIDTWAVDYALLDAGGELMGNPASYRCQRTVGVADRYFRDVPAQEMYRRVGLQVQPFNTIFQLLVEAPERLSVARGLLLMPDLLGYWLTGRRLTEITNASTTGLLDPTTRHWQPDML